MKIKILNVGVSINPGGVENLILNYNRYIDKNKFHIDLADIYGEGVAFSDEYKKLNFDIYTLPNYKKKTISFIKEYIKLVVNNKYDIIHIHMQSTANILVVLLSLLPKSKIICHSHSSSTPPGLFRKILDKINKGLLRVLPIHRVACGNRAGIWMWGKNFDEKNIITNAIDYNKYKFSKEKRKYLRTKLRISDDTFVLGFVGRFGPEKNTLFLLDILNKLRLSDKKYKLLTAGGNDLKSVFDQKIKDYDLSDYYIDLGVISDTSEIYNIMDAFLLPSIFEGFPVVSVEAQANGLLSILSVNISKEVNLSSKVEFLDISDADIWANFIKNIEFPYERIAGISNEYKIDYATKLLEKRYENLLKN